MLKILIFLACISQGTFSIVAMDPETNEWGIAVASKVLDVGYVVPWLEADVGAVATQAFTNPYFGPWALDGLSKGGSADKVLKSILEKDTLIESRQVGIVDKEGKSAAFTGQSTLEWAGHKTAPYVSVQGNILTGSEVIDSMMLVFQKKEGPLAERLLSVLEAGEKAGGDRRGKQSASLIVVRKGGGYQGVDDRLVDLKVVDNPEPVRELRRQYEMWQFAFLAPAYLRLADEEKDNEEVFFKKAHSLLLKALKSEVSNSDVYNNLAWQFALKKKYPEETLKAAKKAHELSPDDANIMDTFAEAYYAAGNFKQAVYWENKALENEPDSEFFKSQLSKFEKALKNIKE
ncbi:DUF1028 domain-containing protein [candidate division WOR-3 bacterium]|nr:DUF1028 domain-containing protein [candidate division WOR-3 bacterium]